MRRRMVLAVASVLLLVMAALPAGAGAADPTVVADLQARFPATLGGEPVSLFDMDGDMLLTGWDEVPGGPDVVAAVESLLESNGRVPQDLAMVSGTVTLEVEDASITAYQVPGIPAEDLAAALVPLLALFQEDPQDEVIRIAGRDVRVLSDGPYDPEGWSNLIVHPDGEVLWTVTATPGLLSEALDAVVPAGTNVARTAENAAELIAADLEAGTIDDGTALLYRIQAQVGDPGLPERYASLPVEGDHGALWIAAASMDSLPEASQQALIPYLLRPTDPRSIFAGSPDAAMLASIAGRDGVIAQAACGSDGWGRYPSASINMVAWSLCTVDPAGTAASQALTILERLYPDMVALMGEPIPDEGGPDAGGDPSIDVYLVHPDQCIAPAGRCVVIGDSAAASAYFAPPWVGPPGAEASSGYLVLRADRVAPTPAFRSDVAHEFFHILQHAHNAEGTIYGESHHWFVEASAKWAEHRFVPEGRATEVFKWFKAFQATAKGLYDPTGDNPYRSYVWPLFMEQEAGAASIGAAWRAMEGKAGWYPIDQALASVVSFEQRFGDFMVRAWNGPLPADDGGDAVEPRFQDLDAVLPEMPLTEPGPNRRYLDTLQAIPLEASPITVPVGHDKLGIEYFEYEVDGGVQQVTVDFSSVRLNDFNTYEALLHVRDQGWTRRTLDPASTRLCFSGPTSDVDRFVLVIGQHGPVGATTGEFTLRPLAEPCDRGPYTLTIEGHMPGTGQQMPGNGTWSGTAEIQCWKRSNGDWDVSLDALDDPAVSIQIADLDIRGARRTVNVYHDNDLDLDHYHLDSADEDAVRITVNEGDDRVTLRVEASGTWGAWEQSVTGTVTCSNVDLVPD